MKPKKFLGMYWNEQGEFVVPLSIRLFVIIFWLLIIVLFFPFLLLFLIILSMIAFIYLIYINFVRRRNGRENRIIQRRKG